MLHPMKKTQKETYDFICKFWQVEGRAPSLNDMKGGKIRDEQISPERSSRTTPWRAVNKLVEKGYLDKIVVREMGNIPYWRPKT